MICTGAVVVVVLLGCRFLRFLLPPSHSKRQQSKRQTILTLSAPHLQRFQGRIRLTRGMCYGFVSGILSAHSLLLAKSAVELLVRTIVDRVNQFNRWQSWVILLGMISLALTQLFYLHRGLKLCSTSVLYPFVFCIYNITAILDGLIYFRQASQLAGYHAGLIALGTIVLLSGVLCLSWRLEDIDSHAAVAPPQSALGPGMGMVEEHHAHSSHDLDLDNEESGERQPLLQKMPSYARNGSTRQRAPSLPLFSPLPNRPSQDMDPDSIWAELDDSDPDYTSSNPRSPLSRRPSSFRPRSKSGTYGLNGTFKRRPIDGCSPLRHYSTATHPHHRSWDPRRVPSSISENRLRRTSSAAATGRKRRTWSPFMYSNESESGQSPSSSPLAAQNDRNDHAQSDVPADRQTPLLAGPRSRSRSRGLLATAWRNSLRYLLRRESRPDDAGADADLENQSDQSQN